MCVRGNEAEDASLSLPRLTSACVMVNVELKDTYVYYMQIAYILRSEIISRKIQACFDFQKLLLFPGHVNKLL